MFCDKNCCILMCCNEKWQRCNGSYYLAIKKSVENFWAENCKGSFALFQCFVHGAFINHVVQFALFKSLARKGRQWRRATCMNTLLSISFISWYLVGNIIVNSQVCKMCFNLFPMDPKNLSNIGSTKALGKRWGS